MFEQNDSGNGFVSNTLTASDAGRLIFGQLVSSTDVDVFKFVPDINTSLEDGVGFTASIRITEDFSAQAGWKFSLVDSDGYVVDSVDSADVDAFAAAGLLELSGSYSSSKPLYVKVETSGSASHSAAQYELKVSEHNQLNEDADTQDYASLLGDIASYSNFALVGSATNDTDKFVFETQAASGQTSADLLYIDTGATITLGIANSEGSSAIAAELASSSLSHGQEVVLNGSSTSYTFAVEYGDVDSDSIALTLRHADGSFVQTAVGTDVNGLAVDVNATLLLQLDPLAAATETVALTVSAKSSSSVDAAVRTIDGTELIASNGSSITSLKHGVAVNINLAADASAYEVELTSATPGGYSLQANGLAARQNPTPEIRVKDYVSGDYLDGLPYAVVDDTPDYSELPVIQVDQASILNLAEIFEISSSDFANIHFFTQDSTPLTGIGTSSSVTTIAATDYAVSDADQQINLSQTAIGDEFTILGFATNASLLASAGSYASEDQYNASGIIGAKIVVSDQGISGSLAASSIQEGGTTTFTLSLSNALTGNDTIEVSLSNASGDLLFDDATSKSVTFSASSQSVDVTVTAVSGDIDFASSEEVAIQITPVTSAYQNLLVSDVALTVTEITPSFSMSSDIISLINDTGYYQYTVTLDNATDFAADNPVAVAVTAPSGFIVATSSSTADALSGAVDFSTDNTTATWYVLADTTAVADADIPNAGLEGQIVHGITYGSRQLTGLDSLTVTRAVNEATSVVDLAGTSVADAITATKAQETVDSLAGDDTLTYTATVDMAGDSFDGGDGADTLILPGARSDYTPTTLINNSYRLTSTNNEALEISNVEHITFAGDSLTIASSELNQAPSVQQGVVQDGGYSLLEGVTQVIDLSGLFVDPENDDLYFNLTLDDGALPSWVQFNATTQQLTLAPSGSDPGVYTLAISASDSVISTADDPSASFAITVTDIPNVATSVADQSINQGDALSLDFSNTFADVDAGDSLTVIATLADGSVLPGWLSFNAQTLTLTGTPSNDDIGSLSVKLTATDLAQNTISDSFDISVANTNDTPVLLTAVADVQVIPDVTEVINLATNFDDIDANDSLTYTATLADGSVLPDWLSFNTQTGALTATPQEANMGTVSINVTATDTFGASLSDSFDVAVQAASVDVSGTIVDRSNTAMAAQTTFTNSATDSQVDLVTASAQGAFSVAVDTGLDIDVSVYQAYSASSGAVTVYDALDTLKIAIGLNPSSGSVTGEQLIAADIDQSGDVSVYDALDILKAAIGLTSGNSPEWVFVDATTDLSGLTKSAVSYTEGKQFTNLDSDVSIDLTGILLGDVDASYTPDIV